MPRKAREGSGTGVFHVMMRGINHQNIFEDTEDYYQFINTLDRMRVRYDDEGNPCGSNCTYYAYCLMNNHFHLLIREREETVGETVKRIASSYVYYYNRKYLRDGHLFKERFRSEPVNDMAYFTTLLRYIHQNPVKAGIVEHVKDYEYSSWGEYDGTVEPLFQLNRTGGTGTCFTEKLSQWESIVENAKAGETSIRNWYISCDDAWYKSPEPTHERAESQARLSYPEREGGRRSQYF